MDGLVFGSGSAEDFKIAVDHMLNLEKWLVSYGDYNAYKKGLGDNHYEFLVCKDQKGDFVSCISITLLNDKTAFVDNFFTMPGYRGRGIGTKLFNMAVSDKVRDEYNVGLHSETLIDDILTVDSMVIKEPRKSFLSVWIQRKDTIAAVVYDCDKPIGYGVMRKSNGCKCYILGPFYLSDDKAFLCLLKRLLENIEEDVTLEIRVPSVNSGRLKELLEGTGQCKKVAKFITQFTKTLPNYQYSYVYGITDTNTPV
uniref:N-acetyltransferase domain-containing protein n=1 Tax=Syphacia muris TaxID=451379 RepID=A0A0N5AP15_9BILA